jgi:hypothetical protein
MLSMPLQGPGAYPKVYYNLMVVSLLGAIYRRHDDADVCKVAVDNTLQDPTRYRLYCAIARGIGGDPTVASEMLEYQMREAPDDDRAKVTLAVAMMLGGDDDWKAVIDNVLACSCDMPARQAANSVLSYVGTLGQR